MLFSFVQNVLPSIILAVTLATVFLSSMHIKSKLKLSIAPVTLMIICAVIIVLTFRSVAMSYLFIFWWFVDVIFVSIEIIKHPKGKTFNNIAFYTMILLGITAIALMPFTEVVPPNQQAEAVKQSEAPEIRMMLNANLESQDVTESCGFKPTNSKNGSIFFNTKDNKKYCVSDSKGNLIPVSGDYTKDWAYKDVQIQSSGSDTLVKKIQTE
jgi:hypothetical protein